METREWYFKETGCGNQAIIIDEKTGRNVAVAYDAEDAPLLATAPELYEALEELEEALASMRIGSDPAMYSMSVNVKRSTARKLLSRARGEA